MAFPSAPIHINEIITLASTTAMATECTDDEDGAGALEILYNITII